MPYTPPAQVSPAASTTTTPIPSRSSSYMKGFNGLESAPAVADRPQLPRSTGSSSYLNRQRRSPTSASQHDRFGPMTDSQRGIAFDPHGSMRQSPPPVTNGLIPSGMTMSPPDSVHNSDDEEGRGRARELVNLEELQAAISQIHVRKASSPPREDEQQPSMASTSSANGGASPSTASRPPLSKEARKISHSRSSTDSAIIFDAPIQTRLQPPSPYEDDRDSDDSDESDGPTIRPPMVRKKSGELVRPALRPASRRRPSSMPGTPTYSKAVHFDSHLEHVRHFLQVDKPLAVSAGSSPVEAYESENEFPFGSDEASARSRGPSYEWEIRLANFPALSDERKQQPIHVERVFLSSDSKNLIGTVAVQNLAFQKFVVARFTLDYWKTTSEVTADFENDVRRSQHPDDGLDRFNFSIRLADQANLENKTLFFCVKYSVNGQDHWDNNSNYNYQVDFTKKPKTSPRQQSPALGARPLNALPRSRPSPPTAAGRPLVSPTVPVAFDDFASNFDNFGVPFGQPAAVMIGGPKIKLRSPKSKSELLETPMRRNKSTPMFGTRYDFNSSLTAAKNHAFAILGEQSGLFSRPDAKQSASQDPAVAVPASVVSAAKDRAEKALPSPAVKGTEALCATPSTAQQPAAALATEKPSLASQTYQEIVDKYCFFGSAKSPPLTKTALNLVDGASDDASSSTSSSGASTPAAQGGNTPSTALSSLDSLSAHNTRTPSPLPRTGSCMSSRSASPAGFNYFFPRMGSPGFLVETPTATAIQG